MVGAVSAVTGTADECNDLQDCLERYLPTANGAIPKWNDATGRTKQEVLRIYDAAIEELENVDKRQKSKCVSDDR